VASNGSESVKIASMQHVISRLESRVGTFLLTLTPSEISSDSDSTALLTMQHNTLENLKPLYVDCMLL
jgi:hypothetical protein